MFLLKYQRTNDSTLEVEAVRRDQFAEFAKAVQVGLVDYQGPQGIKALFSLMCSRYGQVRRRCERADVVWSCALPVKGW